MNFSKAAAKALQKMDAKQRERILKALTAIPDGDIKPMEGKPLGRYRLRVGGYRTVYRMENEDHTSRRSRHTGSRKRHGANFT